MLVEQSQRTRRMQEPPNHMLKHTAPPVLSIGRYVA